MKDKDKVIDMFDMTKAKDDHEAMCIFSRLTTITKAGTQSVSVWMHNKAVNFSLSNPDASKGERVAAAAKYKLFIEDLVSWITSDAAGSDKMSEKDIKLTGNSSFANAFKVLSRTIELGADLRLADFGTVSKCKKWNVAETKRLEEQENQRALVEEAQALRDAHQVGGAPLLGWTEPGTGCRIGRQRTRSLLANTYRGDTSPDAHR